MVVSKQHGDFQEGDSMKTKLISFGTKRYARPLKRLAENAAEHFDVVETHDEQTPLLSPEWRTQNAELLRYERGWGFWCWKPELIYQSLKKMDKGDVLMYCDSQIKFVANPQPLFGRCLGNDGILLFSQYYTSQRNIKWIKRECLMALGCDVPECHDAFQLNAAFSVWSPTDLSFSLLNQWKAKCCDYRLVSDCPSGCREHLIFEDHRHDQAILSLLWWREREGLSRRGITALPDPSQYGDPQRQKTYFGGQIVEFDRIVKRTYPIPCLTPAI
jgi:hypothetical protein